MAVPNPAFDLINPGASGPVVISVPHAGRAYAADHLARMRPPVDRLTVLEDRLVDGLIDGIADVPALIARAPRAWLDLNRHEAEIDPGLVDGATSARLMVTAKVRSGLGLIPRRLAGIGELWRGRLAYREVEARIAALHRPYHQELERLLGNALTRHGVAVLLDLHSMPPLAAAHDRPAARIVIGNRYGQSAAPWATAALAASAVRCGLSWAENAPYAGGYIVDRHGVPARGVHAVQLEIDRALYLDADLCACDAAKLADARAFVARAIAELTSAALDQALPLAAE